MERIVSLAPGLTELLFDLGAGDRIVGRTRWADYPPRIESIPSVGDGLAPNVEMIVAQRPDLVLFYASPSNEAAIGKLEALGIATASFRTDLLDDLSRTARTLGRLLGASGTADSLTAALSSGLGTTTSLEPDQRPAVLLVAWDNPPIVIGAQSFLSEIVAFAGGRNVFSDVDRPSLTTSIEAIVERDPDVVLLASDSGVPAWTTRPEWQAVPAVRDHRFIVVSGSEFSRPSFRASVAVRRLKDALDRWVQR